MKYIYIGGFPPPYGGVTIKNKLLFIKLSQHIEIEHSAFYEKNMNLIEKIISLFTSLVDRRYGFIIGISRDSLKKITHILYIMNKKSMNKSIVMVMGSTFSQMVAEDKKLQKWIKEYKHIYVETNGMKRVLNSVGVRNVSVFPNCRERPKELIEIKNNDNEKVRCLFFSLISKDKGADIVFEAVNILSNRGMNYSIDFYGHIEKKYRDEFEKKVRSSNYVNYCGVFRADQESVYTKMQQYELLLFPTRWKNEGVPGVLVEAKFAGLPAIVSDINFNSEIIEDEKTGIILKQNTPNGLANAIERVYSDRRWLMEMKKNARVSGENYLIENYIEDIVQMIKE